MVEVFLPIGESLETVHHGAIEPVCGVGQNEDDDVDVQGAHVLPLPPGNALKFLVSEEEVALGGLNGHNPLRLLRGPESQRHDYEA
jgi:hypothetical protein